MGIAHHSNYIVWFEIGRTDLCRAAGFPYAEIEQRGFLLVVTEIGCRYRSAFRYDDEVIIRTHIAERGSRAIRFGYELYRGEELCAEGFSAHMWLDMQSRKPVRAPADVSAAFDDWLHAATTASSDS